MGHDNVTQMIDTNISKSNRKLKYSSVFSKEMFDKTEEKFDKISQSTNDLDMTPITIKESCKIHSNAGLSTQ